MVTTGGIDGSVGKWNRGKSGEAQNPYQYALKCFGGKWKMTIIHEMSVFGSIRFNRTRQAIKVSEKVFSEQLSELVEAGLVCRKVDTGSMPPIVTYELTESGKSLVPVLDVIYEWAVRNMHDQGIELDPDALVVHSAPRYVEGLSDLIHPDEYVDRTVRSTEKGRHSCANGPGLPSSQT